MSILAKARQRLQNAGYELPTSDPFGHYGTASGSPTNLGLTTTSPGLGGVVGTPVESGDSPTPAVAASTGSTDYGYRGTADDNALLGAAAGAAAGGIFDPLGINVGSTITGSDRANRAANTAIDAVTGLPFGIASTLVNPRMVETSWGTDFNTGGGGIIGVGGELSRRNLENVYGNIQDDPAYGNFYAPGDIPGLNTPVAVHEGFIPGTTVRSGNFDLVPGHQDEFTPDQSRVFLEEAQRVEQERVAREAAERAAAEARSADEARRAAQAAEALRQQQAAEAAARAAEQSRREREAAEAARAEAQRQANVRAANEELRRQQESGESRTTGGSAVTDRHGNAVRDSGGTIVTSGSQPSGGGSDDSGGGGGGGTWCCTAAMKNGMPVKKVKALRKWHRQQSTLWQDGYDAWGYFIAEKLVKGSPFWASVTEAGHDLFVEKKVNAKSILAWLVIVPGSYIAGLIGRVK